MTHHSSLDYKLAFTAILSFALYLMAFGQKNTNLDSLIATYQKKSYISNTYGWKDRSPQSIKDQSHLIDSLYNSLIQIAIDTNDIQALINRDLFQIVLADAKNDLDWGGHYLLLNSEGGFLADLVYTFDGMQLTDSASISSYLKRLRGVPLFLQEGQYWLEEGISKGKVSPKIIVERCVNLITYQLEKDLESSLFFKPATAIERPELQEEVAIMITEQVIPAYKSFRNWLSTEYAKNAPDQPGVSFLPDGDDYYRNKIKYFTTLPMTPEEVYDQGLSEVARIRSAMEDIILELEFEGSFFDFLNFLRTDPQFYAETPIELLQRASWICKKIESKLPKYFHKLPRNPFTVAPVPDALAPNYTGGRYHPGSYSPSRAGEYWVNTYNLKSRPLYIRPALSLHEAVPGHHLQGSLAQEIDLSHFRRGTYLSAFGEGWALYGEYLGKEMGIYTTAYEDFGRLTYEMWRACRLVIDVGLHYFGWERQKAIYYMAGNTALSMHEVNSEIDRYIGWPGQAVSYKIGELKIRELRKKCESKYKDAFDLARFHDNLLQNGSMPLFTLERLTLNYYDHSAEKSGLKAKENE